MALKVRSAHVFAADAAGVPDGVTTAASETATLLAPVTASDSARDEASRTGRLMLEWRARDRCDAMRYSDCA
ncbi:hypothetical protein [Streptomyces bauhiniae]|uniref:hypothetical protein n=1 Tax=Streptomyces bauhiniae TaxID=2340725 RepID=UPI00365D82FA